MILIDSAFWQSVGVVSSTGNPDGNQHDFYNSIEMSNGETVLNQYDFFINSPVDGVYYYNQFEWFRAIGVLHSEPIIDQYSFYQNSTIDGVNAIVSQYDFFKALTDAIVTAFSIDNSFMFDGVDERFDFPDIITDLTGKTVGTMGITINPTDITSTAYLGGVSNGSLTDWVLIRKVAGKVTAYVLSGGANAWIVTTDNTVLTAGVWSTIDVVQNGVSPVLYIDGVAVAQTFTISANKPAWFSGMSLNYAILGAARTNGTYTAFFDGHVSSYYILDIALNQTQITDGYNSGKPLDYQDAHGANCLYFFNPDNSGSTAQFSVLDSVNSITATSVNMEDADKTTLTPY